MKVILLVLIVFTNGQGQTAAMVTESEEACKARMETIKEEVRKNNDRGGDKIAYWVMTCGEPVMAPKGSDS